MGIIKILTSHRTALRIECDDDSKHWPGPWYAKHRIPTCTICFELQVGQLVLPGTTLLQSIHSPILPDDYPIPSPLPDLQNHLLNSPCS